MYVPGSTEFTFSVHCGEIKQQVNIVSSPLQFWQFLDVKVIASKEARFAVINGYAMNSS